MAVDDFASRDAEYSGEVQVMDGFAFPVEVVRTGRKKSVSIHVVGEVVKVRVPRTLSESRIKDIVTKRTPWITTKLKEQADRPVVKPKEYVSGESFPYLGKDYRLKVTKGDKPSLELIGGYLQAIVSEADPTPDATAKFLLMSWYQHHAEVCLGKKTERLARIVGVKPNSVAVKEYKARWGSCSVKGDIKYNWRLILAPHRVVDYVVIHELCHMLEHNHSPQYWRHVERYVPDWKECRDWLKNNLVVF